MRLTHLVMFKFFDGASESGPLTIDIGKAVVTFSAKVLSITFPGSFVTVFQSIYQSVYRKIKEL